MRKFKNIIIVEVILVFLLLLGCSKSDDQKEFENQAYSQPQDYTAMNANGGPADTGQTDPDDWRISPMYQGLFRIDNPAYPNPVSVNNSFRIDIYISGAESVPGLEIYVFQEAQNLYGPIKQYSQSELNFGGDVLVISPSNFSSTGTVQGAIGLNRLVIFDGRDNIVTYGDILVE